MIQNFDPKTQDSDGTVFIETFSKDPEKSEKIVDQTNTLVNADEIESPIYNIDTEDWIIDETNTPLLNSFFINSQGEESIKNKLNKNIKIGERVVLVKDLSTITLYKGCCCSICGFMGTDFYEIEFFSRFKEGDPSLKSLKNHPDF